MAAVQDDKGMFSVEAQPTVATNGKSVAAVDIIRLLAESSDSLAQAAKETKTETDAIPRNLLAAFARVEHHVDFFLRVTNTSLNTLHCDQSILEHVTLLRREVSLITMEIGGELGCCGGFLEKKLHVSNGQECAARLVKAAELIDALSKCFQRTRTEILIEAPGQQWADPAQPSFD